MADGKPDEGDTAGKETNTDVTDDKKDNSELDKLKAHNEEFEKELVKGRALKAEAQKLEAEKMVGGESDAGQETPKPKEETAEEKAERFERGELDILAQPEK